MRKMVEELKKLGLSWLYVDQAARCILLLKIRVYVVDNFFGKLYQKKSKSETIPLFKNK